MEQTNGQKEQHTVVNIIQRGCSRPDALPTKKSVTFSDEADIPETSKDV